MLKKILAEVNFRSGRRRQNPAKLSLAARQDRYNIRAAIELSRMGSSDALNHSLMLILAGLRDCTVQHAMDTETADFMKMIVHELGCSRGQCFQDIAALHFSGKKKGGFFVEVGTGNGEQLSNTFMLEKKFDWKGILFEPDRRFHESICQLRTAKLDKRPVYSCDNEVMDFLEVSNAGELSTLSKFQHADGRTRKGSRHTLRTTTLDSALKYHNAPRDIDYISIDTEGSELEVLQGLDLSYYNVRFLTVEHNFEANKKQAIQDYLQPFGFQTVLEPFSQMDLWLVKPQAFAAQSEPMMSNKSLDAA